MAKEEIPPLGLRLLFAGTGWHVGERIPTVSADVLLVLSDPRLRAFALAQLQEEGYQVVALPTLGPARRLLKACSPFAVAVVDLADLSDEDVRGLVRSGLPVVAVAGMLERARAQDLGLRRVLVKPVTVGQVVDAVRGLRKPKAGGPACQSSAPT